MKKTILIIAILGMSLPGIAQEKYVVSASVALNAQKFDEAKENIDKAMSSPETREKPKTLFVKAETYLGMQLVEKYKSSNPYREGAQALFKLVELKPDYEKETVDQLLIFSGFFYYNDGVAAYNDKKYNDAIDYMKNVVRVHDLNGGKRFNKFSEAQQKKFDTVAADANQTIAMSTQNLEKYEDAIPLLIAVKNNKITKSPAIYESLIYAYKMANKTTEYYATIEEGRAAYPDDMTLRNYELNYFISSGKQEELVKKLEDAVLKDPNNSDILFNIATTYLSMANPKGTKPANATELYSKSEDAFLRAIKISPDNPSYNYNFGALYFNQATEVNEKMNAISGTSDADEKNYESLKKNRDALFSKATPYFEKAYSLLSNEKGLGNDDKNTYKNTIMALKEIYARQNKLDKAEEMKKKYDSL